MTRKLPWLRDTRIKIDSSSRSSRNSLSRTKRQRVLEPNSEDDDDNDDKSGGKARRGKFHKVYSSPPPAFFPPLESTMEEGLDKDDRYRMVEDEFLDAAKQFTQHLHVAEYQRLKKAAKSQNATIIKSISRPVTLKMPDETWRRVESLARARNQATELQGLLNEKACDSGSEDDNNKDVWAGTALHDLMESSRKAAASLTRIVDVTATIQTPVGFHKRQFQNFRSDSLSSSTSQSKQTSSTRKTVYPIETIYNLSEEDDDLDALVRPRELLGKSHGEISTIISTDSTSKTVRPSYIDDSTKFDRSRTADSFDEKIPSLVLTESRQRIAKRLDQSKLREIKQQQEARRKLEIIPTFLS